MPQPASQGAGLTQAKPSVSAGRCKQLLRHALAIDRLSKKYAEILGGVVL
jgi:hypothetical protein